MAELIVRDLGEQPYLETWEAMKSFTASRDASTPDELWLLEHPRVYTQGQAGKAEHILAPGDIPVILVDRGGQVTYHGPGQLVVYLMIDLTRHRLGIRSLVDVIEQAIVRTLAGMGVAAAPSGCAGCLCGTSEDCVAGAACKARMFVPRPGLERGHGHGAVSPDQPLWLCWHGHVPGQRLRPRGNRCRSCSCSVG